LHVVLIEEPEAHLHAQVQQVFIKKAYKVLRAHAALKGDSLSTQLIVSTHSSHIAHELDFTCLRYFRREAATKEGEIPTAKVVNLSKTFGDHDDTSKFATRYLRTTHCDLFFADATILVEGAAERILVPHFIRTKFPKLDQCYISLLEIGGAHAHRLRPLLETLGLLSLIIADLDAVEASKSSKALPERGKGYRTGNSTLKDWVPKIEGLDELLGLPSDTKQTPEKLVRVAYQCPITVKFKEGEAEAEAIPYTFEDALALTNVELFRGYSDPIGLLRKLQAALGKATLADACKDMFDNLEKGSKAEMALELLYLSEPGEVLPPVYIADGLKWLEEALDARAVDVLASVSAEVKNA
jgi:predicted ATP-dependent endonuclease of OLD family